MPAFFGFFHCLWNAIKNASKKCGKFSHKPIGYIWKIILKFVCIANMNGGPFHSSQWYDAKKSAAKRLHNEYTPHGERFQKVVGRFARGCKIDISTEAGLQACCDRILVLKTCSGMGQRVKLMRWLSVEEQWTYHKDEIWGAKAVLELMADEHARGSDAGISAAAGTTRGAVDGDVQRSISANTGTIGRAHSYIDEEFCFTMDMFTTCTKTQYDMYAHRSMKVKSIREGSMENMEYVRGGWRSEFSKTVNYVTRSQTALIAMDLLDESQPDCLNHRLQVYEFMMSILQLRYDGTLFDHEGYPQKFRLTIPVDGNRDDEEPFLGARRHAYDTWKMWVTAEDASLQHIGMSEVVDDVFL